MSRKTRITLAVLAVLLIGAWSKMSSAIEIADPPNLDRLTKIDGTTATGLVESIDSDGRVRLANSASLLKLDELSSIERPANPEPVSKKLSCAVDLLGGGRLLGTEVTIRNQQCLFHFEEGQPLSIPIEQIAAIRLHLAANNQQVDAALARPNRDTDRIFVQTNGAVQAIEGLVESLDAQELAFDWQGKTRKVPRQSIQAIVLAVVGKLPQWDQSAHITLQSGASVSGRIVSLADAQLTVEIAPKVQISLQWWAVTKVAVRSSRLVFLSDLEPVESLDEPIVTFPMPWQRDKSVSGKRLMMSGRTYDKGLGVHARSLLKFDIGGRFDEFLATIGLDAAAAARGDCIFVVLADEREIYRQRIRGLEPPRDIKLDIRGAHQLTLLVEPGEDLDLADHADWANARLLRLRIQP